MIKKRHRGIRYGNGLGDDHRSNFRRPFPLVEPAGRALPPPLGSEPAGIRHGARRSPGAARRSTTPPARCHLGDGSGARTATGADDAVQGALGGFSGPTRPGTVWGLDGGAAQPAPLTLGETAPDPETLVVGERVLQALGTHLASRADPLGLSCGAALLGEE